MTFSLALTGDMILTRPIRDYADDRFHAVADLLRGSSLAISHLESVIHDHRGPELYPSAEAGWTWLQTPPAVVNELHWLGVDGVTLASNHSLDFSYGGLRQTTLALDRAGLPSAGVGADLGVAEAPAFVHADGMRIGFLSMTSSFAPWSRAGAARRDSAGRPGVNPLLFDYGGNETVISDCLRFWTSMGYWVTRVGEEEWWVNPPGLHNSITRFVLRENSEVLRQVLNEEDRRRHERRISDARQRCDFLVVHMHNHEWDPEGGLAVPPQFAQEFARAAIDVGADVILANGSHAPIRGVEVYNGKPILYDPGDLFYQSRTVPRLPQDFYDRHRHELENPLEATPAEGQMATESPRYRKPDHPRGGYGSGRATGGFLPICQIGSHGAVTSLELHPFEWSKGGPPRSGMPLLLDQTSGGPLLDYMTDLSAPFGTKMDLAGDYGVITLE